MGTLLVCVVWFFRYYLIACTTSFVFAVCLINIIVVHRWNAALAVASFLDSNRHLYVDRNVLELGAGGGLPSIVTVKNGARKVQSFEINHDDHSFPFIYYYR